ncbi:MAG: hypothetical protein WC292_00775 [Clostridia bacterium]
MFFKESNSPKPLPTNRKQLFFELVYTKSREWMKISLVIFLFSLPLLIWLGINSLTDSLLISQIDEVSKDEQAQIIVNIFYRQLIKNGVSIPFYMLLATGLGAISYVARNLVWGDMNDFKADFKKGFKENWKYSLFLGLIFGIIINSLSIMNWLIFGFQNQLGIIIYAFILLIFISMMVFGLAQQAVYNNKFLHLLRNSMILTLSNLFMNILVFLLVLSPIGLIMYFAVSLPSAIILIMLALIGFGYITLILTLYSHYIFDKYINAKHYPEMVNKGINNKNTNINA